MDGSFVCSGNQSEVLRKCPPLCCGCPQHFHRISLGGHGIEDTEALEGS